MHKAENGGGGVGRLNRRITLYLEIDVLTER